jgi:hypothetical protein
MAGEADSCPFFFFLLALLDIEREVFSSAARVNFKLLSVLATELRAIQLTVSMQEHNLTKKITILVVFFYPCRRTTAKSEPPLLAGFVSIRGVTQTTCSLRQLSLSSCLPFLGLCQFL